MESLSLADVYALKAYAKEKEGFYRLIKNYNEDFAQKYIHWTAIVAKVEVELSNRLLNIKF